jgi:hypothetical protein
MFVSLFARDVENYTKLCSIDIDLSYLPLTPRAKSTGAGTFYRLDYDIVLLFGLTELKAQVAWKEGVSGSSSYCILRWRRSADGMLISDLGLGM